MKKKREGKRTCRFWVRQLFAERPQKGLFSILVKDLQLHDHLYFFQNFRMSPTTFELLLSWVGPLIKKSSLRRPVACPAERLCVTIRYLVTGDDQITIATSYRLSPTTVGRIIKETCQVIWNVLSDKGYLLAPHSQREWLDIAAEFNSEWNFPHCLGAIDGKHVMIQAPARSGSVYYNYKKTFSIVLLAICNAKYEFILVDIGDAGRQSDSGVYNSSKIGHAIENNQLDFPYPEPLPGYDESKLFPYTFIGDEAFALKPYMMRPYARRNELTESETIFNYRLSRARRIIENSFGILVSRFRIFRRAIIANVDNVKFITKATVALHNFLMKHVTNLYCPTDFVDQEDIRGRVPGNWRDDVNDFQGMLPIGNQGSNNFARTAKEVRNAFKDYFNSTEGAVAWQNEMVNSTSNPFDEEY